MSPRVYRNLDEIFAGEYEGMTYEEIKASQPSPYSTGSAFSLLTPPPAGDCRRLSCSSENQRLHTRNTAPRAPWQHGV